MHLRLVSLPGDLGAVGALLGRVEAADGHRPIGEHKYLMLFQGDYGRVVGLVGESNGSLVSYVALAPGAEPGWWGMELAVDPDHRSPATFLDLFNAGVAEVARRGGTAVRAWLFQPRLADAAIRAGFEAERELLKVERQMTGGFDADRSDARLPQGVRLESFVPGHDEPAWLQTNNAAFGDHPENGRWTLEILENRMSQPWFRPDELLMAWDGSGLAGFCWLKRAHGEGEIYVIAVAPRAQGIGLGRALVLQGLAVMERNGDRVAFLYVDASNHRALGLYRSLGFYVDHVDRSFVRMLA
ncbi:MAG: mycothiol synthase [Acidimicrobiia bacterium]